MNLPILGETPPSHAAIWGVVGGAWVVGDVVSTALLVETVYLEAESNPLVTGLLEAYGDVGYLSLLGLKLASLLPLVVVYRVWPPGPVDRNLLRIVVPAIPAGFGLVATTLNIIIVARWWV